MNILVLSSVLPAPIATKARENDVLLRTAEFHENKYTDVTYFFVFVVPYSNFILSLFSKKWKDFRVLRKNKSYHHEGKRIEVISVPSFKYDTKFKPLLIRLAFFIYRRKLTKIISANNIDIAHAHNVGSDAGIAHQIHKRFKLPYIVTTRDIHRSKITRFVSKNLKDAKALISLNKSIKTIADRYNSNSYLIPHGIDDEFLNLSISSKTNRETKLRIVTVCRLLDWKNIDKVLLALNDLQEDFLYHIYGEGPDLARLSSILEQLDIKEKVEFKGYIPYEKVPSTLMQYDVFVLLSFPETFGRIFVEAMACGLPIVCSKGCGMDGFIENYVHGELIDHRSKEDLVKSLNHLSINQDYRKELGNNARNLAASFAWDSVVDQLDDKYRKSLDD